MNRIDRTFRALRKEGEAAFIPFLTAGDPDLDTTEEAIIGAEKNGADIIELGFPFSDPVADGPTIQASYTRVLETGQSCEDVFRLVERVRERSSIAIVAMISYSLVYRMGAGAFLDRACAAGLDGATIPDLPVEESCGLHSAAGERDFHLVSFVTPATTPERRAEVVDMAGGFIYYIAVRGITGERSNLPDDLAANLHELKELTDVPVAVGFGISRPEQASVVAREADGVIVGSAIVRRMLAAHEKAEDAADAAIRFIGEMAEATKSVHPRSREGNN
ncbi:MAG: tryptophan synthase subunit alpha [Planctomycetota bacterium]